ncbi:hypothetical protein [Lonsdalea populi]|uniref:hypothetical protein n=1 Tax=Lonsdalea populi TaxID=1172565 RepID=UPI001C66145C|nr:hypothetical protein [Lonsdalea populi]
MFRQLIAAQIRLYLPLPAFVQRRHSATHEFIFPQQHVAAMIQGIVFGLNWCHRT